MKFLKVLGIGVLAVLLMGGTQHLAGMLRVSTYSAKK